MPKQVTTISPRLKILVFRPRLAEEQLNTVLLWFRIMTNNPYQAPSTETVEKTSLGKKPIRGSEYAPCPSCMSSTAEKIHFTWWGGAIGPSLFTHVRCAKCNATYNGKSGKSNFVPILIYNIIGFLIAIVFIAFLYWF